jgi:hypothetical protein
MMSGSTVPREISLEEKRVYVSTPMIYELILPMHVHERVIPTFEDGPSSPTPNVNERMIFRNLKFQMMLLMKKKISPKIKK